MVAVQLGMVYCCCTDHLHPTGKRIIHFHFEMFAGFESFLVNLWIFMVLGLPLALIYWYTITRL